MKQVSNDQETPQTADADILVDVVLNRAIHNSNLSVLSVWRVFRDDNYGTGGVLSNVESNLTLARSDLGIAFTSSLLDVRTICQK
jgi:hypothetical protein